MMRTIDATVTAVLLAAGIMLFALTFGEEFDVPTFGGDVGPAFAPRLFLGAWILLAAIALLQSLRGASVEMPDVRLGQLLVIVAISCATAWGMTRIGFVFATIPGFALFCWAFQYRKILPLLLISVLAPLAIWALFTFGFELLLPHSPWFYTI